jgi:hypothetical protein
MKRGNVPTQQCRACQRLAHHLTMAGFCIRCQVILARADAMAIRGAYADARREIAKQGGRYWGAA